MKKKVVYLTRWIAKDPLKLYPHGYGFIVPVAEFPQEMDAAECSKACCKLSNDEFECIGAIPYPLIDGSFEILGILPQDQVSDEDLKNEVKVLTAIKKGLETSVFELHQTIKSQEAEIADLRKQLKS